MQAHCPVPGYSLQGEGVVVFAGLAVADKVAAFLAESQQGLSITSADGSMIPSGERTGVQSGERAPGSQSDLLGQLLAPVSCEEVQQLLSYCLLHVRS